MSTFDKTLRQIDHTLDRHAAVYETGRARSVALAPYAGVREVIAALRKDPPLRYAERGAIVQALVAEHGASGHELWTSVLILSFEPMLGRRRARLHARKDEDADLDAIVLLSFLEAIKAYPPTADPAFASHALRLGTEEAIVAHMRRAARPPKHETFNERRGHGAGVWQSTDGPLAVEVERILERGGEGAEALMVILETSVTGRTLREHVERQFPKSPRAAMRAYEQIRRAQQKVAAELRARLAHQRAAAAAAA
jgi:hypothetical protein